jgi:hypothetical protein
VPGRVFPAELEAILMRALAKPPEDRFSSATDFAGALHGVLEALYVKPRVAVGSTPAAGLPASSLAPPPVAAPHLPARRSVIVGLIVAAFVLGVLLTVVLMRTVLG